MPQKPKVFYRIKTVTKSNYHLYFDRLLKVLTRSEQSLSGGIFHVPQLILHSTVEFARILTSFVVEFITNRCILKNTVSQTNNRKKKQFLTYHTDRKVVVDDVVGYPGVHDFNIVRIEL